jgi:alanine dehydrogenase
VRQLVDIDAMFTALKRALVAFSAGAGSVPPRVSADVDDLGLLIAMPAYLPGISLQTKLVTVFPGNERAENLPSHHALIAIFDENTGVPVAVLDGTYITAIRTAATAALVADYLCRADASVLAILGAGVQASAHLETMLRIRPFTEVRVVSRDRERAAVLAKRDPRARLALSFEEAVVGADVVACCTDSREPVLNYRWLKPGAHVSSVGGTFGRELDDETIAKGCLFVESRGVASVPPPTGSYDLQGIDPQRLTEVGELFAGTKSGRLGASDITVYKSIGNAAEDAAAARLVYDRARAAGIGSNLVL